MKVLKFRDGADVFVVPEGEVESVSSFSSDGATLTLKSGQEVTVDRRAMENQTRSTDGAPNSVSSV